MKRQVVTVGPPPTPNGDLHLGHLAGPYLMADIYTRYLRLLGHDAYFVSGSDDNQTYVDASAQRKNLTELELRQKSTRQILNSFNAAGITVHGWADYDAAYEQRVINFLQPLYEAGVFQARTRQLPTDDRNGQVLVEGLIEGHCPNCLHMSRGGLCESCGRPLYCEDLLHPHHSVDGYEGITFRPHTILTFPLEPYRDQLQAHFNDTYLARLRPRMRRLVRDVLSQPLIDYPVTYPLARGIQAPFPGWEHQVLNAWVEGMPASIQCTDQVPNLDGDAWWRDRSTEITYFLGFDNIFYWAMSHAALLMAHGDRYGVPFQIYSNEFYEIEYEKASTSKGNVLNIHQLLERYSLPAARFYLALSSPEFTKRSFVTAEILTTVQDRLITPWNALTSSRDHAPDVDPTRWARLVQPIERLVEPGNFSAAHLADYLAGQLQRTAKTEPGPDRDAEGAAIMQLTAPLLGMDPAQAPNVRLELAAP